MYLLKTRREMENAQKIEPRYYIRKFIPAHEERAHNSVWHEPASTVKMAVSEWEYESTPKHDQIGVEDYAIDLSYDEFVEYSEKQFEHTLKIFTYNPNSETANDAIFAVRQYGYILKVELEDYYLVNDLFTDMVLRAKRKEHEGLEEIISYIKDKRKVLLEEEKKEAEALAKEKAEKAEKRRIARIARMEKELERLKNQ